MKLWHILLLATDKNTVFSVCCGFLALDFYWPAGEWIGGRVQGVFGQRMGQNRRVRRHCLGGGVIANADNAAASAGVAGAGAQVGL